MSKETEANAAIMAMPVSHEFVMRAFPDMLGSAIFRFQRRQPRGIPLKKPRPSYDFGMRETAVCRPEQKDA